MKREATPMTTPTAWSVTEDAVYQLFDDIAHEGHVAIGPRLTKLGWQHLEADYPIESCELLFRAQGHALAQTDCLDRVILAELRPLVDPTVDHVLLPGPSDTDAVRLDQGRISGVIATPNSANTPAENNTSKCASHRSQEPVDINDTYLRALSNARAAARTP
jgi:hypothetical protein